MTGHTRVANPQGLFCPISLDVSIFAVVSVYVIEPTWVGSQKDHNDTGCGIILHARVVSRRDDRRSLKGDRGRKIG